MTEIENAQRLPVDEGKNAVEVIEIERGAIESFDFDRVEMFDDPEERHWRKPGSAITTCGVLKPLRRTGRPPLQVGMPIIETHCAVCTRICAAEMRVSPHSIFTDGNGGFYYAA